MKCCAALVNLFLIIIIEGCDNQSSAKHHENFNPLVTNKSILEKGSCSSLQTDSAAMQ